MKKTYAKPELYIESFQLTQSIAKHCGANETGQGKLGTPNHLDIGVCGFSPASFPDVVVWLDESSRCTLCTEADGGDFICYNNVAGEGAFAS